MKQTTNKSQNAKMHPARVKELHKRADKAIKAVGSVYSEFVFGFSVAEMVKLKLYNELKELCQDVSHAALMLEIIANKLAAYKNYKSKSNENKNRNREQD